MIMGPRRTFKKLACLLFAGTLFIYGIINLKNILGVETEVIRHRLAVLRETGYEGLLQYSAQIRGSSGDELLKSPSKVVKTSNDSLRAKLDTLQVDLLGNVTNFLNRDEIKRALSRINLARKTMQDLLDEQPDTTDTDPKPEQEVQTQNKAKVAPIEKEFNEIRTHDDTQEIENIADKLLSNDDETFDDLDDEEIVEDSPDNANVERALPVLKVKRYVDEPLDPHEYNYIHNPSMHCFDSDGQPRTVFVIFLVVTAPGHFKRRDIIRQTYGSEKEWPPLRRGVLITVFLLGKTFNATLQKAIDDEARTYSDIVQEDFVDTYANLSRKTVMGLKWTTNHCRHANYAMKIDDDSMINQGKFLWIFKYATLTKWTASATLQNSPVHRSNSSKYFISKEYYPAPTYPMFMNGPGYLMSTDLVESSYHMALKTPLFPWEDVFLGTCLQKMHFKPIVHKRFMWVPEPEFFARNSRRSIVANARAYVLISNLQPEVMKPIWFICKVKLIKPRPVH